MLLKFKNKYIYILLGCALICILICLYRGSILLGVGHVLYFNENPEKANVIVILRGGYRFERIMQVVEAYKNGYGDKILVPMALEDNKSKQFREFNVIITTEQERIKSILKQLNIPTENIILSNYGPGGGTVGESYRVKKDLTKLNVKKFIVVTEWYHTKRVHNIYKHVFKNADMKFWVVASRYGKSNLKNWWHYRYTARNVLIEFPRTCLSYLRPTFNFSFRDDPENINK